MERRRIGGESCHLSNGETKTEGSSLLNRGETRGREREKGISVVEEQGVGDGGRRGRERWFSPVEGQGEGDECVDDSLEVLCSQDEDGLGHRHLHLLLTDHLQTDVKHLQHL